LAKKVTRPLAIVFAWPFYRGREAIPGPDETIFPTEEDVRKQRPVIAAEWTSHGPAMWDITSVRSNSQKNQIVS
jgi:hypothetical protein